MATMFSKLGLSKSIEVCSGLILMRNAATELLIQIGCTLKRNMATINTMSLLLKMDMI